MAITLNKTGERNATALIKSGSYDMTASWSFTAEDGDKLLGSGGTDWANYAKWHLGEDTSATEETKARYRYPYGKDGKVYRRAVAAIRSRAKQNDATDVFDAAGRLMDAMDAEEDKKQSAYAEALRAEPGNDPEGVEEDPDEENKTKPEDDEDGEGDGENEDDGENGDDDEADDEDEERLAADPVRMRAAIERLEKRLGSMLMRRLDARMEHSTLDPDERTVDMTVSSGAPVRRYDWSKSREYDEVLNISPDAIRMDRLNAGAPMLDSHNYWGGLGAMIGAVVPGTARIEAGQLRARAKFSTTPEGDRAFQMANEGTLRSVSVGYMTHKHEEDETTSPPTYRATDWEPYEVSAVAMPADPKAGFRAAVAHLRRSAEMTVEAAAVREAAVKEERNRVAAIRDTGTRLRLPADFIEKYVSDGSTIDAFRTAALDSLASESDLTAGARGLPGAPAIIGRYKSRQLTKKQELGRLVRIYLAAKGNPGQAERIARSKDFDDGNTEWQSRALVAGIGASGGFLVPEEYYPEVIELLRNRAVVRRLGALVIPMEGGNLSMPRLQGGANAGYVGEAVAQNASQETFNQVRAVERKLMALVPVSNDLLKFATPQADEIVLNDMVAQIAVTEDAAFIRGSGSSYTPKGMRYWAPAGTNVLTSAGTGLTNFVTDLEAMESALETQNVRMINPAIILNPRSKNAIKLLQSTTGQFVFRDEMREGTLDGYPFGFTNNIPANLGGGSQTEWYLVDLADAVITDVPGLEIEISREAAYVDSTGTMQAAFSQDVTVLRAIERHDFVMRHDFSVAVMTAVAY